MKLHLPLSLRAALLACLALVSAPRALADHCYTLDRDISKSNLTISKYTVDTDANGLVTETEVPYAVVLSDKDLSGAETADATFYYKWVVTAGVSSLTSVSAGEDYDFKVDYYQNGGTATYGSYDTGTSSYSGDYIDNSSSSNGGALSLSSSIDKIEGNFIDNFNSNTWKSGGAIYLNGGSINSIEGSFIGNYTTYYGGAIYSSGSIGSITGDFVNNSAYSHGGAIYQSNANASISSISSDFIANTSTYGSGGAIYTRYGSITKITGNFIGNASNGGSGGAIYVSDSTIGDIIGDMIGNTASSDGGAVALIQSDANYTTSISSITGDFISNSSSNGGAININYNYVQTTTNIGSITGDFIGNVSTSNGGAIRNQYGIIDSIIGDFIDNTSGSSGGAIYLSSAKINSLTGDFIGNSATSTGAIYGGAIYSVSATVSLIDSSFIDNSVTGSTAYGGAIYNAGGIISITASTEDVLFSDNTADVGQAIYNKANNSGTVQGTINLYAGSGLSIIFNDSIYNSSNVYIGDDGNGYTGTVVLNESVSGSGTLHLDAGTLLFSSYTDSNGDTSTGSITGGSLVIDGGTVVSDASNFISMSLLENNASITLTGGTLTTAITGSGTISITSGDSVSSNADYLGNDISNAGTLELTDGTLSTVITGTGDVSLDRLTVQSAVAASDIELFGIVTISDLGGLRATDVINIDQAAYVSASADNLSATNGISNAGYLNLTGGTLSAAITGLGNLVLDDVSVQSSVAGSVIDIVDDVVVSDSGSLAAADKITIISYQSRLTANADALSATNDIFNDGRLNLTGGSLSTTITGIGDVLLNGVSVQSSVEAGEIEVLGSVALSDSGSLTAGTWLRITDSASLTTNADQLSAGIAFINAGELILTGGTLSAAVTGSGTISIASGDSVSSNADYLGNDISNEGELVLTGGKLSVNINDANSMTGTVTITGAVDVDEQTGSISANTLNISATGELTIVQGGLNIIKLVNDGTLNITEGSLDAQIDITNNNVMLLDVANVTGDNDIANAGDLTLQGNGTLLASITNDGASSSITLSMGSTITLDDAASLASADIRIESGSSLTANASNLDIDNGISNAGELNLTSGTLSAAVTGSGTISIASGDSVSSNADYLGNAVSNEGTLSLTDGTVTNAITGSGTVSIASGDSVSSDADYLGNAVSNDGTLSLTDGTVTNAITGSGTINIASGDSVSSNADYLGNAISNEGTLSLTDGTLANAITGSGTISIASGDSVSSNADYLGNALSNEGTLSLTDGTVTNAITGSGTISIASGDSVSSNADYLGNTISNEGTLSLTGGTLDSNVNATDSTTYFNVGTVSITGDVTLGDGFYLAADVLNIAAGASFDILSGNVFVNTVNSDSSLLIDGDLYAAITGSGEVMLQGDLTIYSSVAAGSMELSGTVTVDDAKGALASSGGIVVNEDANLITNASSLSAADEITNKGSITLTGGALQSLAIAGGTLNFADAANTSMNKVSLSNTNINLGQLSTTASVTLGSVSSISTISTGTNSSISDSSITLSYDTQELLSMMESNQSATIFTGGSVALSNVTVTISQSDLSDDIDLDFFNLNETMSIAVVDLSDSEDSTYSGVSASFEGTSFEHLFRNVRVVDGVIIVDVRGDIYDDAVTSNNGKAGAQLLNAVVLNAHPESNSDLDLVLDTMDSISTNGANDEADRLAAAVAGASVTALGSAQAQEMTRQLGNIAQRAKAALTQLDAQSSNGEAPQELRFKAWITGEGGYSKLAKSGTAAGHSFNAWGATLGADIELAPKTMMGLAVGATYGSLSTDGPDYGDGDLDTTYVSLYASHQSGDWTHGFAASLGWSDASLTRSVSHANGTYKSKGDTNGLALGLSYELSRAYALNEEKSSFISPILSLSYIYGSMDGYTEHGSDAALIVGKQANNFFKLAAGVEVAGALDHNIFGRPVMGNARALMVADLGDRSSEADVTLIQNTGSTQTVAGAKYGPVGLEFGAGLSIPVINTNGAIFADINCELRSKLTTVSGTVGYRFSF